jgi:DNA polymerase I-like protein with 3'-5' exonuclease and polymerase domains
MKPPVLVDIETTGEAPFVGDLLLLGACRLGEPVTVFECEPDRSMDTCWMGPGLTLEDLLMDPEVPVISMTKYDARYLNLQGWEVTGPYYDIQVMAWLLNENQALNLDSIVQRYLRRKMDKRLKRSKGVVYFKCDDGRLVDLRVIRDDPEAWAQFVAYCRRDVEAEAAVFQVLWDKLGDTTWLDHFLTECVPFTEVLLAMECAGLPVNLEDSELLRLELEYEVEELEPVLLAEGGLPPSFNLGSRLQMASYLYHPVGFLAESLDLGEWACGALRSCLDGEHEDCWTGDNLYRPYADSSHYDPHELHVKDLLPVGFSLDKLGRTQAHGTWTFPGRGLTPTVLAPKCDKRECDHKGGAHEWSVASPALKANLQAAQDPWVQQLFTYRMNMKALTTYLRKYPELAHPTCSCPADGRGDSEAVDADDPDSPTRDCPVHGHNATTPRLYGRFNQTGTKTGRLSSSEPNLQNQPSHGPLGERMRSLFQGRLIVGDYSQLEPRLMAHFSEDPVLMDVFINGRDLYRVLAAHVFGVTYDDVNDEQRGIAKVLVLAMGYGAGAKKVAQILTINGYPTTEDRAAEYLVYLTELFHRFFAWREHVIRRVKATGYVSTLSGRHRRLRAAFADLKNWKNVGYGERQAVNAIVQGSAGDIVSRVMVRGLWQHEQTLLAQVHDELVWEWTGVGYDPSPQQLEYIQEVGETAHGFDLRVPLLFEPHFGHSWYSAKEGIELPEGWAEEDEAVSFDEAVA